ncbi:Snf7 family protein-like protein [Coleophoma crateriformis]|uniref:Snf7 family protein-like protein n=1 Tax=Coleophoma crateriformis TaxID=565419 RepID=A0A3D8S3I9_9HELO|nr:Snf7 family protein-like protein [Coleophoma crateriformis]
MSELLDFLLENEDQFRKSRLAALYSDFRQLRTINPDGYAANVEAWRKGLASATRAGHVPSQGSTNDLLVLTVDEGLLRALETKQWGRPLALGTVIREAIGKREMMPLQEFMTATESIYQKSWNIRPWGIISWGLRQLGVVGGLSGEDALPTGRLVILANVEEASKNVSNKIGGRTSRIDRIYSKAAFQQSFENALGAKPLSQADMDVLLKFLAREKGLVAYDGATVKIKASTEASASAITIEDTSIASLKSLISDIESQTDVLTQRIEQLSLTARDAVSRKNKASALAALRSKKLAETTLSKRTATLGQLEEVFSKIEQAADQVELVRAMEGSTRVLSGLNAEVGGVERVDDVVEQLREQMSQVNEVGDVIAEVGQGTIDETEVDDELEAMESAEREKKEEEERKEKAKKKEQEAAETKRKLDALDEAAHKASAEKVEKTAEVAESGESTEALRRLSLEEKPERIPAS